MLAHILEKINEPALTKKLPAPWYKQKSWIAAASIIGIISIASLCILLLGKGVNRTEEAPTNNLSSIEIKPGKNAATLTLDDGTTVELDSASNGNLAVQGKTMVFKDGDEISYTSSGAENAILYNTMATARGNQYHLQLSDGSLVWLNASSSIHYPTYFGETERRVEITGEVYFEVAHNANKPFVVDIKYPNSSRKAEVEVLGTHFNINAYEDEESIRTTLLQGSVKINAGIVSNILKPGQQAILAPGSKLIVDKNADLEEVMGWRNGAFVFNSQNIQSIMRQISRWYNVDIIYDSEIGKETYSGVVSRSGSITDVLSVLNAAGTKTKVEGKKMHVFY